MGTVARMDPWQSLLGAAQTGAEWAWDRIYRSLAPKVRGYLVSRGASDPDGLLGEVWLQVARNIGTFEGDEDGFRSWVFMIAHHRLVDERRKAGRRPDTAPIPEDDDAWAGTDPAAEQAALVGVEHETVLRLLSELTDDQRDVLALRILGDLTVEEVAEIVGKRPGAVKALQRRAIRSLRRNVEEGVPL